jgi:phosphoglycolate phosphatase-like HAD superfamily hydrolase
MSAIRLVVFDMDGVVVDSMPTLTVLASYNIARYYAQPIVKARDLYQSTVGLPFREQLTKLFPAIESGVHDTIADYYEEMHLAVLPLLPLAPGIESVLWQCRARGILTGLISSTEARLINHMPQVRDLPLDCIRGQSGDIDKLLQFQDILQHTYVTPNEAVLFGDSLIDGKVATKAGSHFRLTSCKDLVHDFEKTLAESIHAS